MIVDKMVVGKVSEVVLSFFINPTGASGTSAGHKTRGKPFHNWGIVRVKM